MSTITLSGTYGKADVNPGSGYVDIVPMVSQANDKIVIVQEQVHADLDGEGRFSVTLIPSDDDGWVSGPIPYIFREFVNGRTSQWMAYVYAAGPYDIADLVPLDEAPDMYIPVPGPPNVLTVQNVITVEPDEPADVKIYGTSPSQELEFYIPKGEQGPPGPPGSGSGGVTDHGALEGLQDDDHPQYLTPVRGAARYEPKGLVAEHEAKDNPHPQYALASHEHALAIATRVFRLYEATSAPTAGNLHIATSGQVRTFRVSKEDIAGTPYSLVPMLPGDSITVTDNPDTPPISGFARYVTTSDVIDMGSYWEFTAQRTDTSGSTAVTPGTEVRFIPTMSAGLPTDSGGALPTYLYQHAQDVSGITTLWTRILTMPYDLPAGVYEVGFSVEWISDVADQTFYVRVSRNAGSSWRAYSKKNTDTTQYQTFFYQYPTSQSAGASTTYVEVKSETGVSDVEFADVWVRRVA